MEYSSSLIAALRSERDRLARERASIDQRLAAIDVLLPKQEPERPARAIRVRPEDQPEPALFPDAQAAHVADGLRGTLRQALESGPLAPGEAIAAIKHLGYVSPGRTPVETRVYNELGRMRKLGMITRDEDGRYRLMN